jgi:hypothetical protein
MASIIIIYIIPVSFILPGFIPTGPTIAGCFNAADVIA